MLGSIGMPELIIIFVIALIIFGPRKLPELGRSLGKTMVEFKRATSDIQSTIEQEIHREAEAKPTAPSTLPAPPASEVPPAPAASQPSSKIG